MPATRLLTDRLLTEKTTRSQIFFWFGMSLLVAFLYSLSALEQAFRNEYIIQDDARQHVFWMLRFLDPGLFPNDLTADYFQSVAPWGYTTLYRTFSLFGIDPITTSKILPSILGLISTAFCFGVAWQILPIPMAGFTTATLLNQNLWMRDDLSSATPGAFFYPIFLAFLYFLLRGSLLPCLATIALQGLFYPQCVFLSAGLLLLRLLDWQDGKLQLSHRRQMRFCLAGLAVALLVMLLYALKSSQFGAVISLATARNLVAFSPSGWSAFFSDSPIDFWFCGKRSGLIPTEWCDLAKNEQEALRPWLAIMRFPAFWLGALFPVCLKLQHRLPASQQIHRNWHLIWQAGVVSVGMFFLAHFLAFRLHLPNRYTEHSLRIFLSLTAGLAFAMGWNLIVQRLWRRSSPRTGQGLPLGLTAMVIAILISYPYALEIDKASFPVTGYVRGEHPELYRFFARQPKDIVIASLTEEANQLPTFAQRSLLVGGEGYLLPYHPQYFQEMSQRLRDLIRAQYSPDLAQAQAFIQQYNVDFWLLDQESFQPNFADPKSYLTSLFAQFPAETEPIKAQLQAGTVPALAQLGATCAVSRGDFRILRAKCILRQ
jgi:hypothetical protein